jgi:replicative DNA helicase
VSQEAEASVLGALMLVNEAYWRVADRLTEADFAHGGNRTLFRMIGDQVKAGKPADFVTLAELDGELAVYASEILRLTPSAVNVVAYADIVRKAAEKRRLRDAGKRIVEAADYEDALSLLSLVRPQQAAQMKSVKDGLSEMVAALQARYDAADGLCGVPTGVESLDALTAGWQPGDLVILAARPSMGKTAFALQAAIAAGRCAFFSLEMTAGKLIERAVANMGDLPYRWIRFPVAPETPDYASGRVLEASKLVARLPLLIDDQAGLTVDAICSRARQAHMQEPLKLVVVDHLGIISRPGKHDPTELGQITTQLKGLAKSLGVPVLLLCQLNRGVESRTDKRPVLSDLRDSGRIEEDADLVIALYRDEYHNPNGPLCGYVELLIRKARDGELGTAWARAKLANMRMESCDEPERPAQPTGNADRATGFQARSAGSRKPQAVS